LYGPLKRQNKKPREQRVHGAIDNVIMLWYRIKDIKSVQRAAPAESTIKLKKKKYFYPENLFFMTYSNDYFPTTTLLAGSYFYI